MSNKMRYTIMIVLGIVIDYFLSLAASALDLPFFLDLTGTALVAIVLEPAAGMLVGLVDNFLLAVLYNGPTAIWYFSISAMIALLWGTMLVKKGKPDFRKMPLVVLLSIIGATVLSSIITLIRLGTKVTGWEGKFQKIGEQLELNNWASAIFGIFLAEAVDLAVTGVLVIVFYYLLPKKLKIRKDIVDEQHG